MRSAALLAKVQHRDAAILPAASVLSMATINGARAIGREEDLGSLETGKQADLIQVAFTEVRHGPLYDVNSHLVYVLDSQDVMTTIVAGQVLMRDRQVQTLDEEALRKDVARVRDQIRAALAEQ